MFYKDLKKANIDLRLIAPNQKETVLTITLKNNSKKVLRQRFLSKINGQRLDKPLNHLVDWAHE